MFARLTTTVLGVNQRDESAEVLQNILPTLTSLSGFKGLIVLVDSEERAVVGMTLWDSAEALDRNEPVVGGIRRAETSTRDIVSQESSTFRVAAYYLAEP
jgi:hypothetical protein